MGLDESPGKEIGSRREGVGNKGLEKNLWGNPEIKENKIPIQFHGQKPRWVDSHTYKKIYMNIYGFDLR